MRKILCILIPVLLAGAGSRADKPVEFDRRFKLLPRPQHIEPLMGKGFAFGALRNICLKNTDSLPVLPALLEGLPCNTTQQEGTVTLLTDKNLDLPSGEGYTLELVNGRVLIRAKQQAGLFYGLQTLNQLLEDAHDQSLVIPACNILDYPSIPVRAIHLDLKSHLDAGRYYYHIVDELAKMKINTLIIEFEDKLRYRRAPLVGAPHAISIEEFAAISRYAKKRNIEISPLVQGLGHASFILKHPEYKALRDDSLSDHSFDPLNPGTYELQFAMYEDAIAATPYGKYLHIGGDEVGSLGKSALAKKSGMKRLDLQMYWLKKVTDFAVAHNRIPIFWDDMVFKLAGLYQTTWDTLVTDQQTKALWAENRHVLDENIALFPKNCIYARWNYESPQLLGNQLAIDWYVSHNLQVMNCAAAQQGYQIMQRNHSNFPYIQYFCRLTAEKKTGSILCAVWDDSAPHFETVWRGVYNCASFSWNARPWDEAPAYEAFRQRFYSPELAAGSCEFQNLLEDEIWFWETAFLREGDREDWRPDFKLVEMPDSLRPGDWSKKYKDKIAKADSAAATYRVIRERIGNALSKTRRNRYSIEVMEQINEIQVYSANLLLLFHRYDMTPAGPGRQQSLEAIREYTARFPGLRAEFEKVYSKTRMTNPAGYVHSPNNRSHWADVSDNTDWTYWLELKMNEQVSKWLAGG